MMPNSGLQEWLGFYRDLGVDSLTVRPRTRAATEADNLAQLHSRILECKRCPLHKSRHLPVPGEGAENPEIMFVGEGPGEQEDRSGRPFVGKAGQLLDRIIERMGMSRETVFIGNIIKCRPPGNRNPLDHEVSQCIPFLKSQIAILRPRVIVCLGKVAVNRLLEAEYSISRVRGRQFSYEGIPVIPTFHPSYILHQKSREAVSRAKWDVWSDMQIVLKLLKS